MENQALPSTDLDLDWDSIEAAIAIERVCSIDFTFDDLTEIQQEPADLGITPSHNELSHEIFTGLENIDLLPELQNCDIDLDEIYATSPSDSGISENQGSPISCDGPSLPGSPIIDTIITNQAFVQTEDASTNPLVGVDHMLTDDLHMSQSSNDSASESEFPMIKYPATKMMEEFKDSITDNMKVTQNQKYPRLILTIEEKKLLDAMNISLPSHLPLTKSEERNLKTVRRKIRNKASAQESRRKKKMYIDDLEDRVTRCTEQNTNMKTKMQKLEKDNMSLLFQLKKLQAMVTRGNKPAQASTCVMVLLLSFALFIAPSFNPFESKKSLPVDSYQPAGVISRTLQSIQDYESVMNMGSVGGAGFTPAKANHVDSFFSFEKQDVASSESLDIGDTLHEEMRKLDVDGVTVESEDLQTIYNTSELESDENVYDGGKFGRKIHVLNDEI